MKIFPFIFGLACGAGATLLAPVIGVSDHRDEFVIDATYFLEISRDDLEAFSNGVPSADGRLRSAGNVLGGTDITTIRHAGRCGSAKEIVTYIREYLGNDRYICYETRYRK